MGKLSISFARALVELSAESNLKCKISIAIPNEDDSGDTMEIIKVNMNGRLLIVMCVKFLSMIVSSVQNVLTRLFAVTLTCQLKLLLLRKRLMMVSLR